MRGSKSIRGAVAGVVAALSLLSASGTASGQAIAIVGSPCTPQGAMARTPDGVAVVCTTTILDNQPKWREASPTNGGTSAPVATTAPPESPPTTTAEPAPSTSTTAPATTTTTRGGASPTTTLPLPTTGLATDREVALALMLLVGGLAFVMVGNGRPRYRID
ncbi:MAG: hypothetical protein ABR540_00725 [Acidimicrobiales bacterium]